MRLEGKVFHDMERLARSSWGNQGIGRCADKAVWIDLVHEGLARPVLGQPKFILALSLKGFRALEAERLQRKREQNKPV